MQNFFELMNWSAMVWEYLLPSADRTEEPSDSGGELDLLSIE